MMEMKNPDHGHGAGYGDYQDLSQLYQVGAAKTINLDAIPDALKSLTQWVCWRIENRNGKDTKVPYSPVTDSRAETDNPATWGTLEQALTHLNSHPSLDGIGFVFSQDDPFCGIDLDKCIDPTTGEILKTWSMKAIERIDSYTERSPSGRGFHIIAQAQLPGSGHNDQKAGREMYDQGRFFTMTGQHWAGTPTEIETRQDAVSALYGEWWPPAKTGKPTPAKSPKQSIPDTDQALIERACKAKNGDLFHSLWNGNWSPYPSLSEADQALCNHLAFWTDKDAERIDRLFRSSGLFRDKWDKKHYSDGRTYGQATIAKAIEGTRETYQPKRPGNEPVQQSAGHIDLTGAWPDPQPLKRCIPPARSFPVDALGNILGGAVEALHEVIQSPVALCAQSVLAGAALATQGHADIEIDGRTFPLSENFITVAESGERKSSTDREALVPHAKRQRQLREIYEKNIRDYEFDLAAWKKAREEALSSKQKGVNAKKQALQALGPEPQGPIDAILMVEEPTYEGLIKALLRGWPSMGLFSDEGGRFLGGHGMNQENQLKTATGLSKLWDGSPITRSRSGDGSLLLYGRRLSLHLMIQPVVSHLLFNNGLLIGQGLLSRCLVAWPTSNIGQHRYREKNLAEMATMQRYFGRLMDILEAPLPVTEDSQNELVPRRLTLSPEAKAIWVRFHDRISALCGEGQPLASVRGQAAKAAEHAARLAGMLTLVKDLHAQTVAREELEAGIALMEFYLGEALRLFEAAAENPDLELAERCLAWAKEQGGILALVDLYQKGPNSVRNKATAERIIGILEDHGWIRPMEGGAMINGRKRREVWEVRS